MMSRSIGRAVRALFTLVVVLAGIANAGDAEARPYAGRSLHSVLDELRDQGVPVLYSDAVVRPQLQVVREPLSHEPREILEEILRPHSLTVREMPSGQIVVVPLEVPRGSLAVDVRLESGRSPAEVEISIPSVNIDVRRISAGTIVIDGIPAGTREVMVSASGFIAKVLRDVELREGQTTTIEVALDPILHLEEIVVTPAQDSLSRQAVGEQSFLSGDEIEASPHIGDDIMRAVTSSPGIVQSDYSAKFNPRGGGETETLVLLDGVELYEPFHLKDFLSIFSIVDSKAVGEVDLLTGAFTAEYGDRMSAVMDISVLDSSSTRHELTLGTLNSRLFSSGRFNGGAGEWLMTARGWYPTQLPDSAGFIEGQLIADYYDLLGRVRHPISTRTSLAVGILGAYDDLSFHEQDELDRESISAVYRSTQSWAVLDRASGNSTIWRATLSLTEIDRNRGGEEADHEDGLLEVADHRSFESLDLKFDWSRSLDDRHLLKWGGGAKRQRAVYEYGRSLITQDPEAADELSIGLRPGGLGYHAYLSDRFRLGERTVIEIGLRWDHQDWLSDSQISPRANLKIDLGSRTEARLGWGRFHQSQRINELAVEDGQTSFHEAEMAEHLILSLLHRFRNDWSLRSVAYEKQFEQLRPRSENLFSRLELFPESRDDRVLIDPEAAHARGLELVLRSSMANRTSWWVGYTLSEAVDVIAGDEVPRSWDQRHAIEGALSFRLPWELDVSLAGTWHSGRPTTGVALGWEDDDGDLEAVIIPQARNQERLGDYGRIDLRAGRRFPMSRGTAEIVLQVFNLTNRANICFVEDFIIEREGDDTRIVPEEQACSPFIPTLAVRWQF